jgi:large subunit ribosomal protein L17
MRHRNKGRVLGRESGQRRHLLVNIAKSIIIYEKVRTTLAKAKEVRGMVEKMISASKNPTLAVRRRLIAKLGSEKAVKKLFEVLGPRYAKRAGGYTRVVKLGFRQGDAAKTALIELV